MAGANTLTFDNDNFEDEVVNSSQPVLVDFWAEWCGPCRMVGPIIDQIADEYQGRARVGKVDVDKAESVSRQFNIQSIPTVILFANGQPVERILGARPKADYVKLLDAQLTGGEQ